MLLPKKLCFFLFKNRIIKAAHEFFAHEAYIFFGKKNWIINKKKKNLIKYFYFFLRQWQQKNTNMNNAIYYHTNLYIVGFGKIKSSQDFS